MTAQPVPPAPGIRLAGDAPIPPAPSLGTYRPVDLNDRHIGSVLEVAYSHHLLVCVHRDCYRALPAHPTYAQGKKALRDHWRAEHGGAA